MLVLALQFSKGSGRGRTLDISSNGARRGQRERELHAVRRGSTNPKWVDSLKTEEKTKLVEPACQEDESYD
jgi:hypothetical protein